MHNHDLPPTLRARVLAPAFVLCSLLGGLTGCPAKTGCPMCNVSGVMAEGSTPDAAPNSTLHVQLDGGGGAVKEVHVTLTSSDGSTEKSSYSGDQVADINNSSMTDIPDPGLYDIDGKAPVKGEITIVFSSGKSFSDSLSVSSDPGRDTK